MPDPASLSALLLCAALAAVLCARAARGGAFRRGGGEDRGAGFSPRAALPAIALLAAAVLAAALPLGSMAVGARRDAAQAVADDRHAALLEALWAAAAGYVEAGDAQALAMLPSLAVSLTDAAFVTILGGEPRDVVLATSDPHILDAIDTPEFVPGVSRLRAGAPVAPAWFPRGEGDRRVLALSGPTEGSISVVMGVGPIAEGEAHARERRRARAAALLVSLAALAAGAAGLLALSASRSARARALLGHARRVLDERGERALSRMEIRVGGRDEIAALGAALNGMSRNLARAAATASELEAAKRLQRKLLPLDSDGEASLGFGRKDSRTAAFFAYYEAAGEISGDYFDYRNLDGRYYAIMKCDVAGSGVPAALITMQISTMFLSYFWTWEPSRAARMDELVYMINGFIEQMGAGRRFAALAFCIYDSQTGEARFCNAGDNVVRVFDASEGRVRRVELPESPAAGILGNEAVASAGGGYQVRTLALDPGDILLLFTDGLDESRRRFRGPVFEGRGARLTANRIPHGNYVAGQWGEEFGTRRVDEIANAVMSRGSYRLHKWHTPDGREEFLSFDFSGCSGGAGDVVMALAAVEKMFRCYRAAGLTADDRVPVDRKIDAFLKACLAEYGEYCSRSVECPDNASRMYYTHLREEQRHDDLAILGLGRK